MIKAIDVSEWQGNINFTKVKAAGIGACIVRYADGTLLDDFFDINMAECQKKKIHFGAYIYSRARNKEEGKEEARRLIAACKKYKFDLPLYIDMESPQNREDPNGIIDGFLEVCDAENVKGGIYANLNWFLNYIDVVKYVDRPLWIAQYYDYITDINPSYFGMWQYTSIGKVDGIAGYVDLNHLYVKYWDNENEKEYLDNIKAMAVDTILGKYGSGQERKERLGEYYDIVQELVNTIYLNCGGNKK